MIIKTTTPHQIIKEQPAIVQAPMPEWLDEQTQRIVTHYTHALDSLFAVGQTLLAVKGELPHGEFSPWIDDNLPFSRRQAERLMNVASRIDENRLRGLSLGNTVLYELSAPSTSDEVIDECLALAHAGQPLTIDRIKEIKQVEGTNADPEIASDQTDILQKQGAIAPADYERIRELYPTLSPTIQSIINQYGLSCADLIPILQRLEKNRSETLGAILRTGHIPSHDAIPICEANARDLQRYLDEASFEHKQVAIVQKQEQRRQERDAKMAAIKCDSLSGLIIDDVGDVAGVTGEAIIGVVAGASSVEEITAQIIKQGGQILMMVATMGNPIVKVDGERTLASDAVWRMSGEAGGVVERLRP